MQWLAELCIRRPIFGWVLTIIILVVGGAAYSGLGVDQFPKVDLPIVIITTVLPGSGARDMESDVSDKIEEAVNTVGGIDELRSISAEGVSQVVVTFVLEKNADVGVQEIRDAVNRVLPDLPAGIDPPTVSKLDPDASPILYIALRAPGKPVRDVTEFADKKIRRDFETVLGVGQVKLIGGVSRQVNVRVKAERLRSYGLTIQDLSQAISSQNLTVPGGTIESGGDRLTLRVDGRVKSASDLERLVLRDKNGGMIRVEDVATVEDAAEEPASAARWNGESTVVLAVRKQSGSNTITVVDSIREKIEDLKAKLPNGYSIEVLRDNSGSIRTGTEGVKEHLILGALLAALVVLLFLGNARSTLIAAFAIPTSIIGTFAVMAFQGYTLNVITLLALALAVGIVIDDAIVVLENIFSFIEKRGYSPVRAAREGTKEIGPAVLATTLSLVAVFLPVAFLGGIPGRFLASFGVTMSVSIAVSLFVSFTLTPMLASQWLKLAKHVPGAKRPILERAVDVFYKPLERGYLWLLAGAMKRRWIVVIACVVSLGGCFPLAGKAKTGFLPDDDKAQFEVVLRAPEGTGLRATELEAERMARALRAMPEVTGTLVTVGADEQKTQNQGSIYVALSAPDARKNSQSQVMNIAREKIVPLAPKGYRVSLALVSDFGGGGMQSAKIQYYLKARNLDELTAKSTELLSEFRKIPGAVDVDSNVYPGKPEIVVRIDRDRAADLGVNLADAAGTLRTFVEGEEISRFSEGGEQFDIHLRSVASDRVDEASLRELPMRSAKLGSVPLGQIATLVRSEGPSVINRLGRQRVVQFFANAAPGYSEGGIGTQMQNLVKAKNLPADFKFEPAGQTKEMAKLAKGFLFAMLMAFVFMYLILAAQFNSWLHPVTILSSLPLTLPFAVLSIVLFDQAIDMFAALGIFVLFGVVKKNAILQVDHTNQLRREGQPRDEAILHANRDRLRPILMTTIAFVAGMMPLLTSKGIGSGFNRATAGVIVGGQSFSLLLTLVAVPVIYSYLDDLSQWIRKVRGLPPLDFTKDGTVEDEEPPPPHTPEHAPAE